MVMKDKIFLSYATRLILGSEAPLYKERSLYHIPLFRNEVNISKYQEDTKKRIIIMNDQIKLKTHNFYMTSGVASILTINDGNYNEAMSDGLFSEHEYEIVKKMNHKSGGKRISNFYDYITVIMDYKIKNLSSLIECLYYKDLKKMPIFLKEFPNTAKFYLKKKTIL